MKHILPTYLISRKKLFDSPLKQLDKICAKYPNGARLKTPHSLDLVMDIDHIKHILKHSHREFEKDNVEYKVMSKLMGEGLVSSKDSKWEKTRQLCQKYFSKQETEAMLSSFQAPLDLAFTCINQSIQAGAQLDVNHLCLKFSLECIQNHLFGTIATIHNDKLTELFDGINLTFNDSLLLFAPIIPNTTNRANKQIHAILEIIITQAYHNPQTEIIKDLKAHLTFDQFLVECKTLIIAGAETVASLLSWCLHELANNPDYQKQLRIDNSDSSNIYQTDKLNCILFETMRLYPPVWGLTRKVKKTHVFQEATYKEGQSVLISLWSLNRSPQYWDNPLSFNPERFKESHKAFIPFALGPRNCIGNIYAQLQSRIFIQAIAQYQLQANKKDIKPKAVVSVKPSEKNLIMFKAL